MNFLRKTSLGSGRHFRPGPKRLFVIVGLASALVLGLSFVPGTPLKDVLTFIALPFWQAQTYVSDTTVSTIGNMRSKSDLINENASLNAKVLAQEADIVLNRQLQAENDELKAAFGRTNQRELVLAANLNAPGISAYDTVLIDIGANFNIKPGALAFFSSTTAAGYVAEVYSSTALVRLYSTPEEEVPVYAGDRRFFTKAVGQGGGNFIVKLPHDSGIKEGDLVMLPGTPALVLGKVGTIETDVAKSLQVARLMSPYNISETHFLYVQAK